MTGLPITISGRNYALIIKAMFGVGCFAGLVKVMTGSVGLLAADAIMLALIFLFSPRPEGERMGGGGIATKSALFLSAALIALGFCQSFNPNVPTPGTGLFYFRISTYPFACVFIGYKMLQVPGELPGIFRFLFRICIPICSVYALIQSFHLDPLSIKLVKHLGWGQYGALGTYRVTGFFQGPMQLGLSCAMGCGYLLVRNVFQGKADAWGFALFVIFAAALAASMSRASLLGFASFALVSSLLMSPRLRRKRNLKSFLFHIAFMLALPISALALVGDLETIEILAGRMETLGNVDQDNSFKEGRINNWKNKILPILAVSPAGRGNGSTGTSRSGDEIEPYTKTIVETESLYFSLILELGWLGGALAAPLFIGAAIALFALPFMRVPDFLLEAAPIVWIFLFAGITSPNMSAFPVTWLFFFVLPPVISVLDDALAGYRFVLGRKGGLA